VLFGDWSLNSTASSTSFSATFTMMPLADSSDSNNATEYRIDNLRANTVQQINNIAVLGGRTDVASNGTATFEDVPTTIML
jgi:menaquinone-dependent protoporphyrinogen IX oxidase